MSLLSCLSCPLFILGRLHTGNSQGKWKESNPSFNFKFRYIDHVISLNKVDDFVDCIYAIELEIKHFTDTSKSTSYHDLHLDIDCDDPLRTAFYDKRDDFNSFIVSSLFIYLNMWQHYNNTSMCNISLSWSDIHESVFPIMIYLK